MVAISMLDIYKVFVLLHMIYIGIWFHHHTASVTFVGLDFWKVSQNLGSPPGMYDAGMQYLRL
jgi:hypothetical protein